MTRKVWNRVALAAGALGVLAAIGAATAPALGASIDSGVSIKAGPVALGSTNQTLVKLSLGSGRWLITGKMWADSITPSSTPNTVVGCSVFKGSTLLDASAFNTPKVGSGTSATSAGVNMVSAVVTLSATTTISFRCNSFGSMANAHSVVLTAIS